MHVHLLKVASPFAGETTSMARPCRPADNSRKLALEPTTLALLLQKVEPFAGGRTPKHKPHPTPAPSLCSAPATSIHVASKKTARSPAGDETMKVSPPHPTPAFDKSLLDGPIPAASTSVDDWSVGDAKAKRLLWPWNRSTLVVRHRVSLSLSPAETSGKAVRSTPRDKRSAGVGWPTKGSRDE